MHVTGEDPVGGDRGAARPDVADARRGHRATTPPREQPPGSWWVPASHGGGAPTLAEAAVLDGAEKRERARKRAEKRAQATSQHIDLSTS